MKTNLNDFSDRDSIPEATETLWTPDARRAETAPLTGLGPWLEYVDLILQSRLQWQQQHEDDRFGMTELLLSPDELDANRARPTGLPYWYRQTSQQPWSHGVSMPVAEGRLAALVERFALTHFETQVLMLTALPLFDARYGPLIAYLQDSNRVNSPGIDLALTLFGATPAERITHRITLSVQHGTLLREGLVSVGDAQGRHTDSHEDVYLRLNTAVFHFLNGEPAETLYLGPGTAARWVSPSSGPSLSDGAWAECARSLRRACFLPSLKTSSSQLILLQGGPGRMSLVSQLAAEVGCPVLALSAGELPSDAFEAEKQLDTVRRAVRLYNAVLVLDGGPDGEGRHRALLETFGRGLTDCALPVPVICLATTEDDRSLLPGLSRLHMTLPSRGKQDDMRLLQAILPPDMTAYDRESILRLMRVDPDNLPRLHQEAQGYALLRSPEASPEVCDFQLALRMQGLQNFGALARRVQPRRTFGDLIVSDSLMTQIQEILVALRQREGVLARGFDRKVGYGTGISALFHGEPGTGKSMAAEVLAGELGTTLIRVDLSTVVNKYIGETEKNLSKIFDLAIADSGVLLFDEADALFGKRSEVKDAHDRHANIEVSYLLQRLEQYPGLVVLTTNNRTHLDEAFTRRLTFITRFDAPDATLRERMWQAIWPDQIRVTRDVDWAQWAAAVDLTGAGIRNVALLASWLAAEEGREVTQGDILHATRRELNKMGRIVPPLPVR